MTTREGYPLKVSWRTFALLVLVLGCGIVIGRFSAADSFGTAGDDQTIRSGKSEYGWSSAYSKTPAGRQGGASGNGALELRQSLDDPDPVGGIQRFTSILQTITASELPEAAKSLWSKPGDSRELNERKRLLGYRWGQLSGSQAVKFAQAQTGQVKVTAISAALAGWSSVDPLAAKQWIDGQVDPRIRHLDDIALVDGWARHDLPGVTRHVLSLTDQLGNERMMEIVAGEQVRQNPAEAGTWALELPEGTLRKTAIEEVAARWAWADPSSALDWVGKLSGDDVMPGTMSLVMGTWARADPASAGDYLNKLSEGLVKDHAIKSYSATAAVENPAAGAEWAASISDSALREATLVPMLRIWLDRDRESALNWLPQSGLSEEARKQLQL